MELEIIPDSDMYIFFEKGTGGRTFYISEIYIAKQTRSIYNLLIQNKKRNA